MCWIQCEYNYYICSDMKVILPNLHIFVPACTYMVLYYLDPFGVHTGGAEEQRNSPAMIGFHKCIGLWAAFLLCERCHINKVNYYYLYQLMAGGVVDANK